MNTDTQINPLKQLMQKKNLKFNVEKKLNCLHLSQPF